MGRPVLRVWKSVELRGSRRGKVLCWPDTAWDETRISTKGLFWQFCRLADAPPDKIRRFAEKWGPLLLCRHDLPFVHLHHKRGGSLVLCDPTYRERVEVWQRYARSARTLVQIADEIRRECPVADSAIWHMADPLSLFDPKAPYVRRRANPRDVPRTDRDRIGRLVDLWLELGDLRAVVSWPDQGSRIKIGLGSVGLFSWIASELIFKLANIDEVPLCRACGEPFTRETQKVLHCDTCKKLGIPNRNRQRRFQERKAAAGD